LDKKIDPEQAVPSLRFGLGRLSKKEISGVEKKNGFSFILHLTNQGRFLGHTAKGIPKSPAGFNLSHHVIGIHQSKLNFGFAMGGRRVAHVQKRDGQEENQNEL
jgi:hypothetical protein